MRSSTVFSISFLCVLCVSARCQLQIRKVSEPAGKTLEKATRTSTLLQKDTKPFHVRLEVVQTKGEPGEYAATIEETWISPARWVRRVQAHDVTQLTVMNDSGMHFVTTGTYFPHWLRNFEVGLFTPVPDPNQWNLARANIEYIVLPNGMKSEPCQHAEFLLGDAPLQQVNFANDCFSANEVLLTMAQSPSYTVTFGDYAPFHKLRVARTLSVQPVDRVEVVGRVVLLEDVKTVDEAIFKTPPDAQGADSFESTMLRASGLLQLAGGLPELPWPSPMPGHGMFTVWVCLDRNGRVREAHSLNSDESGLAAEMSASLIGRQWKPYVKDGVPMQVQGAIVFEYPPQSH